MKELLLQYEQLLKLILLLKKDIGLKEFMKFRILKRKVMLFRRWCKNVIY